jgi:leucyl/phenylalanyl-tRNA---protein transferase
MPVELPPSAWVLPTPSNLPDEDLVGMGADLEPATLLAAYRAGFFPMPSPSPGPVRWFHPVMRGILPLNSMRLTRSLRRSCRRYDIRVNTAFVDVVAGCADPLRPGGWIDSEVAAAYTRLHELGWAHSVETWLGDRLVGGLYGVAVGGLFAGESMFHRERDASKVALAGLVDLLSDEDADRRLIDVQWRTDFLGTLGVVEVPRSTYLALLDRALDVPLPAGLAREKTPGATHGRS